MDRIRDAIAALPGVTAVAITDGAVPMNGDGEVGFWIERRPSVNGATLDQGKSGRRARQRTGRPAVWSALEGALRCSLSLPLPGRANRHLRSSGVSVFGLQTRRGLIPPAI